MEPMTVFKNPCQYHKTCLDLFLRVLWTRRHQIQGTFMHSFLRNSQITSFVIFLIKCSESQRGVPSILRFSHYHFLKCDVSTRCNEKLKNFTICLTMKNRKLRCFHLWNTPFILPLALGYFEDFGCFGLPWPQNPCQFVGSFIFVQSMCPGHIGISFIMASCTCFPSKIPGR